MLESIFGLVRRSRLMAALGERDSLRDEVEYYVERWGEASRTADRLSAKNAELSIMIDELRMEKKELSSSADSLKRTINNLRDKLLASEQECGLARRRVVELSNKVGIARQESLPLEQKASEPFITVMNFLKRNTDVRHPSGDLLRRIGRRAGRLSRKTGIQPGREKGNGRGEDYGHWTYPASLVSKAANEVLNKLPA